MFLYCLVLAYRLVFIYNTIHTLLLGLHYVQVYSSPACSLSSRPDLMFVQMHRKCVRNTHTVVWLGYRTGHALPMEVLLDVRGATRRMPRRGRRTAILHASSRGARASSHSNKCTSHSSPPRRSLRPPSSLSPRRIYAPSGKAYALYSGTHSKVSDNCVLLPHQRVAID